MSEYTDYLNSLSALDRRKAVTQRDNTVLFNYDQADNYERHRFMPGKLYRFKANGRENEILGLINNLVVLESARLNVGKSWSEDGFVRHDVYAEMGLTSREFDKILEKKGPIESEKLDQLCRYTKDACLPSEKYHMFQWYVSGEVSSIKDLILRNFEEIPKEVQHSAQEGAVEYDKQAVVDYVKALLGYNILTFRKVTGSSLDVYVGDTLVMAGVSVQGYQEISAAKW